MNYPLTKSDHKIPEVTASLVPQESEEIIAESTAYSEVYPTWWQEIITPWSLAALLLLLGSNTLLSLAQGWQSQKKLARPAPTLPQAIAPPIPLQQQNPLTFNRLSQIPTPPPPTLALKKAPTSPPSPPASLTQAILPVAAQPQWLPIAAPPPPPAPVVAQTAPKPSARQPQPTISPDLVRARVLEETRLRELTQTPLGFNHRTRARLQSAQTQGNPAPLIQQMQQEQQKKVPSSIIIDGVGSQVNY